MQEMSWGSLMSAVGEGVSGEKRAWAQDRAGIKERWRQISTALTELRDTQSAWTIPDASLRANMKDAVAEDFVPLYKVSRRGNLLEQMKNSLQRLLTQHRDILQRSSQQKLHAGWQTETSGLF